MGLGTETSPPPRSGSGIRGMPSAVRLTNASGVWRVEQQVQHCGVIRAQRARERIWIIGDPETGAEHHTLGWTEGHAEARREQRFADLDPEILRHRSHAADHHLVRVHVVALEAAGGARGHREVLPSRAVRDRHLRRRLPLIADIEAVLPVARGVRLDELQPADPVGYAEQERGERVVLIAAGSARGSASDRTGSGIRRARQSCRRR